MGNHLCGVDDHSNDIQTNRTMSTFRNFEPQTCMVIGAGIPNVSSQVPNNPQQNRFEFNDTTFDSKFESGNLAQVERTNNDAFNLWISPDCYKTPNQVRYQSWFFFKVEVQPSPDPNYTRTIQFRIKNLNLSEYNNMSEGMVPVYSTKSTKDKWKYLPSGLEKIEKDGNFVSITFQYSFNRRDCTVFFAYSFPYTHTELTTFLDQAEKQAAMNKQILFQRDILAESLEGRPIELITITEKEPECADISLAVNQSVISELTNRESQDPLPLTSDNIDRNRKYILITCRSQASGISANYVLEGLINALISSTSLESKAAAENFVFLIIPMINPDGVVRGHSVTDTQGKKLSSSYHTQISKENYPALDAVKRLVTGLNVRLHMYWDLESTTAYNGATLDAYMIGNHHADAEAATVARLFDIYSSQFSLSESKLVHSEGILRSVLFIKENSLFDKMPQVKFKPVHSSKKRSNNGDVPPLPQKLNADYQTAQKSHRPLARNFLADIGGTHLSFTLKTNMFKGKPGDSEESKQKDRSIHRMTQDHMREIGVALLNVILEYNSCHPKSLLPSSQYASFEKLKNYSQFLLSNNEQNDLRKTIA